MYRKRNVVFFEVIGLEGRESVSLQGTPAIHCVIFLSVKQKLQL